MYLVRNVFAAKPGKAKELATQFKSAAPHFTAAGIHNVRILTDRVAAFWTVVVEYEVEDVNAYFELGPNLSEKPQVGEIMKGYRDLVDGGYRQVFTIE